METAILFFIGLIILIAWGIPVGVALALAGMLGTAALVGNLSIGLSMAGVVTFDAITTFAFMCVPMFILMGELASYAGISGDLYDAAYKNVGRLPGGLAVATTLACASFASITGSSMSTCVAMTRIALPEMNRFKYDPVLSLGCIASAGTFAIMIPPSIMLVAYAIFAEQSIGKLLLAGVIPGLITAVVYSLSILVRARLNPSLGPRGPAFHWKVRVASLSKALPFLMLLGAILAGILFGLWSPVEAAAGGVIVVLVMGFIRRKLTGRAIFAAVRDSTITCTSVFVLVIGCLIFGKFIALSGVTKLITESIVGWGLPPLVLFAIFGIFYLFLGCFLEGISQMALTLPLVLPIVSAVGWSPIWFGIIITKYVEIACITPPVGMNLYAMKSALPDMPLATIIRGVIPFIPCDLCVLVLLYFYPQVALWLPSLMIS